MRAEVFHNADPVGTIDWTPDACGVQVNLDCAVCGDELLRCYAVFQGNVLRVGLPAPEHGRLRLRRRIGWGKHAHAAQQCSGLFGQMTLGSVEGCPGIGGLFCLRLPQLQLLPVICSADRKFIAAAAAIARQKCLCGTQLLLPFFVAPYGKQRKD